MVHLGYMHEAISAATCTSISDIEPPYLKGDRRNISMSKLPNVAFFHPTQTCVL
jgi:hypothetical protein